MRNWDKHIIWAAGLLLASLVITVAVLLFNRQEPDERNIERLTTKLEQTLTSFYDVYDELAKDDSVTRSLVVERFESPYFEQFSQLEFEMLIFQDEELVVWNDNAVVPDYFLVKNMREGSNYLKMKNGYYEIIKTNKVIDDMQVLVLGFIPIRRNYQVTNKYLTNSFNELLALPDYVELSKEPIAGAVPIMNYDREPQFYLYVNSYVAMITPRMSIIYLNLANCLLILGFFNLIALWIAKKYKPWIGWGVLVLAMGIFRYIMLKLNNPVVDLEAISAGKTIWYPVEFYKLEIFNPRYFASSFLNRSLGDLLINVTLGFNVVLFFFSIIPLRLRKFNFPALSNVIAFLLLLVVFGGTHVLGWLFESLLSYSKIPFDLNNFMSLTSFSLLGLISISIVLFSYLLVSYRFLVYIHTLRLSKIGYVVTFILALGVYALVVFKLDSAYVYYISLYWVVVYLLFLIRQIQHRQDIGSFTNMMIILILFSLFSAIHIDHYNNNLELEQYQKAARDLATRRDPVTEYLFLDKKLQIQDDQLIQKFFKTLFIPSNEVISRIRNVYFKGYFSNYDVLVFLRNRESELIGTDEKSLERLILDNVNYEAIEKVDPDDPEGFMYFVPKGPGRYTYIINLAIQQDQKILGFIILELRPKTYSKTNLYPELLLEENMRALEEREVYSYAVYEEDHLIEKKGSYPYQYRYNFTEEDTLEQEFTLVNSDHLEHLVYQADNNRKVVVSHLMDGYIQPTTLFSYLFCVFLLFSLVIVLIRLGIQYMQGDIKTFNFFNLSFKDKIQYSMISIMVLSFLIIGFVTIFYLTSNFDTFHRERLVNKERAIRSAIEYGVKDSENYKLKLDSLAKDGEPGYLDLPLLSVIHEMDVNVYDLKGQLISSSLPEIFDKSLQSKTIDPEAYRELTVEGKSQVLLNESIGSLDYLSIYVPLRNNEGELLAYLNLPYFAKEKELRSQISSFLVAVVNVYVFLLVIGGFLAYVFSNSVTRPLAAISEKLKFTQLGKKNEPIEWKGDDEIGKLVEEYNKMIGELEESADVLAKSERESAWREMAKQIAHEIKNPLTPMKLSIQHLQRAIQENRPNVNELADRVTKTLIEQIENLTHIASEFSSFAKMPKAQNEVFDLGETVRSVKDLFNDARHIDINLDRPEEVIWVYADKNQMLRAFNNLVKNAVQAIGEEREDGKVGINIYREGVSKIVIAVQDNGVGISEEKKNKVFVPNFTTKSSGTGLGLAITKQIIENAGGEIWFDSLEGTGTTFYIKLPEHKIG